MAAAPTPPCLPGRRRALPDLPPDEPLPTVTLGDLQAFADSLAGLAPASRGRILGSVKALLAFGHRLGYLPVNVGRALRLKGRPASRPSASCSEAQVQRLLALEPDPRNALLLRVLYYAGLRVGELCGLRWRDVAERGETAQLTAHGKGGKVRVVLLPPGVGRDLLAWRRGAGPDEPVFRSRQDGRAGRRSGRRLGDDQVRLIVQAAAARAGLPAAVSPHWLRHAHASHALERGATVDAGPARRSATPTSPPPRSTCTPAPATAPAATWPSDGRPPAHLRRPRGAARPPARRARGRCGRSAAAVGPPPSDHRPDRHADRAASRGITWRPASVQRRGGCRCPTCSPVRLDCLCGNPDR